jgi:predicted dehydrogenase/threonine dehydrogenase-like Zn-dependent dehydrogenase
MKQVLARSGKIVVEDIPAPSPGEGMVLVRVVRSCISAGTESAGLGSGTLVNRVRTAPAKLKDVTQMVLDRGVTGTVSTIRNMLEAGQPLGYSLAGRVEEVGPGLSDLRPGDRVACAGAGLASHAEFASVPRNLVVPIPDGVSFDAAATVALGSIALHGIRRLEPTLGETFVVVGLGLLGQLAVQMLRANGCRVIGIDLDAARLELAQQFGLEMAVRPDDDAVAAAQRLTGGLGADGVLITAGSSSDEIMSSAFRMCRPKGRVVLVGDVGLNLRRADFFPKELEFRISTSYGPGRYDPRYEQQGLDYPIGYVRWTEGRNMEEYLRLIASGAVRLEPLVASVHAIQDAPAAYAALGAGAAPIVLLAYGADSDADSAVAAPAPARTVAIHTLRVTGDKIRTAVIGAGSFARGVHLPNLKALDEFAVSAVMSRSGVTARTSAEQFGASYATTDYDAVLSDADTHAVIICTRHNLHAEQTLAALRAGKHVLVEKPLALTADELALIDGFYAGAAAANRAAPVLLTGFNRRFSPYAQRIRAQLEHRTEPAMLVYRMNAGYLPANHWVHSAEGGGRNIGEACHIYDLFLYLIDARVTRVEASAIDSKSGYYGTRDNFTATLHFDDGSLATLIYTALGTTEFAKERLEAYCQGTVAVLDDYRRLEFHGTRRAGLKQRLQDKGHREELRAFGRAIRAGGSWPIPLEQQLETSRISLQVEEAIT